ncbi:MAG: hypothetical protein WB586_16175 [Chthoniobacterales bacterium]
MIRKKDQDNSKLDPSADTATLACCETAFVLPVPANALSRIAKVLRLWGPGVVTGAADDDPSGIATYSQVGAQFGFSMLWTMPFIYPFMAAIQEISSSRSGDWEWHCR